MVAILAVVAGWRFTPPPRVLAAAIVAPLAIHIHTENAMFQVLISPGKVGVDHFVLQLMNGEGSPLPAKEATLTLSLPERGIEPFERKAVLGADGYWSVRDVPLPFAGRWQLAHRRFGDGFREGHAGGRVRRACALKSISGTAFTRPRLRLNRTVKLDW